MSANHPYAVEVELPAEAFRHHPWSASEVSSDLRLLWLVDQVRQRRLGYAKAAELAHMPQATFVQVLGTHHISPFDMDKDELEREIVVADAGPLIHLSAIGQLELIRRLSTQVLVPRAVLEDALASV